MCLRLCLFYRAGHVTFKVIVHGGPSFCGGFASGMVVGRVLPAAKSSRRRVEPALPSVAADYLQQFRKLTNDVVGLVCEVGRGFVADHQHGLRTGCLAG